MCCLGVLCIVQNRIDNGVKDPLESILERMESRIYCTGINIGENGVKDPLESILKRMQSRILWNLYWRECSKESTVINIGENVVKDPL